MHEVPKDQHSFTGNDTSFVSRFADSTATMTMLQPSRQRSNASRLAKVGALAQPSHVTSENSHHKPHVAFSSAEPVSLGPSALNAGNFGAVSRPSSMNSRKGVSAGAEPGLTKDRFIPRTNKSSMLSSGQPSGVIADALGVKMNRVLEFTTTPQLQRKFAPADFISQYALPTLESKPKLSRRYISTKPEKILDAPGLIDDFYMNVLDWSGPADIMAIGLSSTVYAWNPRSGDVSVIADLAESTSNGSSSLGSNSSGTPVVTAVKWSQEDSCLAVSTSQSQVQLWDASTGTLLRTMKGGRRDRVACLSWNEHVLSAGGRDGSVWNHDVRLKKHKVSELRGHTGEVCGLTWRRDGRVLASGGNDNLVNLWDARVSSTAQHELTLHQAAVKALAWCPWQNNLLASGGGSADQQINFWNATTGHCAKRLSAGAQVTSLHWSEEHREIAATLGYPLNSVRVWSYPNLESQAEISNAHDARILASTLSGDGQTLVTCSGDESIKMWNLFATDNKPKRLRTNPIGLSMGRI